MSPASAPGCGRRRPLSPSDSSSSTSPHPRSGPRGSTTSRPWKWIRAAENVCLSWPAGTGRSHTLIALGIAAVEAGAPGPILHRRRVVERPYRGLADISVGKIIEDLLRNELGIVDEFGFAPLDDPRAQVLFRFVAAAYERRSLVTASHWPFESWGRFLTEHPSHSVGVDTGFGRSRSETCGTGDATCGCCCRRTDHAGTSNRQRDLRCDCASSARTWWCARHPKRSSAICWHVLAYR